MKVYAETHLKDRRRRRLANLTFILFIFNDTIGLLTKDQHTHKD
jgi:hypothetical protein